MKNKATVLLVEDDLVDIKTVQRAFKEAKITNPLDISSNGEEALKYLAKCNENGNSRPGIILLDLNMPVMGGFEFLKEVKNHNEYRKIPVIVLTTSRQENERVESFKLGVAGYIIKPVDFGKFVEAVKIIDLYWTLSELPE